MGAGGLLMRVTTPRELVGYLWRPAETLPMLPCQQVSGSLGLQVFQSSLN